MLLLCLWWCVVYVCGLYFGVQPELPGLSSTLLTEISGLCQWKPKVGSQGYSADVWSNQNKGSDRYCLGGFSTFWNQRLGVLSLLTRT